ncbi:hypothetical protein ACFSUD_05345 [Sulfitobacter aestuarii]|uniref:DUF998 domain-containing protein n=1 Tax=Sulfitobacter aestuarii TaxID=2161676 RepID=A0ABW5U0J1_9RHOB
MRVLQTHDKRYQPDRPFEHHALVDQKKLAFIVGLVAFCLPAAFWIGANLFGGCYRISISHFYYAPFWGGPFIGALVFIGAYLIVYKGESPEERRLASIAGYCALGVGLLSTDGHGCLAPEFRARAFVTFDRPPGGELRLTPGQSLESHFLLQSHLDILHLISAAALFAILAWFSLMVFTRIVDDRHRTEDGRLKPVKVIRNTIYYACGAAIVTVLVLLLGLTLASRFLDLDLTRWHSNHGTFRMEAIALYAFGLSWMVKGRFFNFVLRDRPG